MRCSRLVGMSDQPSDKLTLLTGASGYVGGELLRELQSRGQRVRCLARRPERLRGRVGPGTEVVWGDVLERFSESHLFLSTSAR